VKPMKTRSGKERRHVGLLNQLSERVTVATNDVRAAQCRPEGVTHHISHLHKALDGSSPADNGADRRYRVCFMNRFARGRKTITARQRSIVIRSAASREAAIEAAKQRFAELEGIPNWKIQASFIEAGLLEDDTAARREADEPRSADDYD
jgi:hypothetical protein